MCKECKEFEKNQKQEKIRDIDLSKLPRKDGVGANKGKQVIDWKNSIGCFVNFAYNNIQEKIEIVDYNSKKICLIIKYKNENVYKIGVEAFKKCNLGDFLNIFTSEFRVKVGEVFKDNKRDLIIIDRKYRTKVDKNGWKENKKYYKYKCNKCGYDKGWMIENQLLNRRTGCSVCCNSPRTIIEGINDIPTTEPWMVKFFQGGYEEAKLYTKGSHDKIYPICPDCGRLKTKKIKIIDIYMNHSIGCSCGDGQSYPFKIMFNVLEQLNINFETEYSPEWCKYVLKGKNKKGRYDFYFEKENKKYIVEMDGIFHYKSNKMSGQSSKESKFIDNEKDRLADEHEIEVVRIDSIKSELEYIKNNILNSKLNNLFNLSKIDWSKVEEFAYSSLVKKACELKRENPNLTTTQIGESIKTNYITARSYLKKGNKLGWCDYNPKEELNKTLIKGRKSKKKKIEIFKDNTPLGVFDSITELVNQSEILFGYKFKNSLISKVCKGERNHHHGFTFKYIS